MRIIGFTIRRPFGPCADTVTGGHSSVVLNRGHCDNVSLRPAPVHCRAGGFMCGIFSGGSSEADPSGMTRRERTGPFTPNSVGVWRMPRRRNRTAWGTCSGLAEATNPEGGGIA
jgi:hypothetical protein